MKTEWNILSVCTPPIGHIIYLNYLDDGEWISGFHYYDGKLTVTPPEKSQDVYWILAEGLIINIDRPTSWRLELEKDN